tara:strand:- start:1316 stop:1468 length:153 start_codon:yes stop_codon:yes gene_type:complete
MKVGDLVRRKRRGWLALVLAINKRNMSADLMWIDSSEFDNCSMSLLEVVE